MLITTLEELRLFSPANAIDNIESLTGFINSSEHDFLEEKLGHDLYISLAEYYKDTIQPDVSDYITAMSANQEAAPYAQLLYCVQKIVTYDALARAINLQAISVNGAGVNVTSADDYKPADAAVIADYKRACIKESHSAVNELLTMLERWTIEVANTDTDEDTDDDDTLTEKTEITSLWEKSRYFYLAASMLIPSATVLQDYYNIYDSREKFIQLLPDIRYIQEDVLAPIFGEDFIDFMAQWAVNNNTPDTTNLLEKRILHALRKVMARHLEARILEKDKERKETAYNEAIKLTTRLSEMLQTRQDDMSEDMLNAFLSSPLYVAPVTKNKCSDTSSSFNYDDENNVIFITPGLF